MNYKPFSQVQVGALFRDLDSPHLLLMKLAENEKAVVIEAGWVKTKLYPRGTVVSMGHNECVDLLEGSGSLPLPLTVTAPVDPRKTFWTQGKTRRVGRDAQVAIEVFAGLFVYSGFGMGTYYGAADQEEHWLDADGAQNLARKQGVPFVHYDGAKWTSDPSLARERAEAQERFDAATETATST